MNLISKCNCEDFFSGRELDIEKFDAFEVAYLLAIGKVHIHTPAAYRLKAVKELVYVPPFWPETILLSEILRKEWAKASEPLFKEVFQIFKGPLLDLEAYKRAVRLMPGAGAALVNQIKNKVESLFGTLINKSRKHFQGQADRLKKEELSVTFNQWESWLKQATQDQLEAFAEKYPERILHPQIQRQVATMQAKTPDQFTEIDINDAFNRMVRLSEKDYYWETLSGVQVSFLWSAEGIFMAADQKISAYQIANPWDQFTCPVCKRLYGIVYQVADARQQIMKMASLTDPDDLKALFPFPRTADVDRATADEIRAAGFMVPPFHGRCRCEIVYLWSDEAVTVAPQMGPPQPPPLDGFKVFPNDSVRAQKYQVVYDQFKGMKPEEIFSVWKTQEDLGAPGLINAAYIANDAAFWQNGVSSKYLQLIAKTAEDTKSEILFPSTWAGEKSATGIVKAAESKGIYKFFGDEEWIRTRAVSQAYIDASKDYKKKITLYQWVEPEKAKELKTAIDQALVDGKSFLTVKQQPLDFWSSDLEKLTDYQNKVGGIILKREFAASDIVYTPELLNYEGRFMVRNMGATTKFSLVKNVQAEPWIEGWNPIGNPLKPIINSDTCPEGWKAFGHLDAAIIKDKELMILRYQEVTDYLKLNYETPTFMLLHAGDDKKVVQILQTFAKMMKEGGLTGDVGLAIQAQATMIEGLSAPVLGKKDWTGFFTGYQKVNEVFPAEDYAKAKAIINFNYSKAQTDTITLYKPITDQKAVAAIKKAAEVGKKSFTLSESAVGVWSDDLNSARLIIQNQSYGEGAILKKEFSRKDILSHDLLLKLGSKGLPGPVPGTTLVINKNANGKITLSFSKSVSVVDENTPWEKFYPVGVKKPVVSIPQPPPIAEQVVQEAVPVSVVTGAPAITDVKAILKGSDEWWSEFGKPENFVFEKSANLAGAHEKVFYTFKPDGSRWMFKPVHERMAALSEEAAYKAMRLVHDDVIPVRTIELQGRFGSLQPMYQNNGDFLKVPVRHITKTEIKAIQREHVIDWLISNHDGHAQQFLRGIDSQTVYGIDKGQAFKYFPNDRLDISYRPHSFLNGEGDALYNKLFKAMKAGELTVSAESLSENILPLIKRLETVSDNDWISAFENYAAARFKNQIDRDLFLSRVLERKHNIRGDIERFYERTFGLKGFKLESEVHETAAGLKYLGPKEVKVVEEAAQLGAQGKAIVMGGRDAEDMNVLVFRQFNKGQEETVVRLKVRAEAKGTQQKIIQFIEGKGTRIKPPAGLEQYASPVDERILPEDKFFQDILEGVKTIKHHKNDLSFNTAKVENMVKSLKILEHLSENASGEVKNMANYYLGYARAALKAKEEGVWEDLFAMPQVQQYLRKEPIPVKPPVITGLKEGFEWYKGPGIYNRKTVGREIEVISEDAPIPHFFGGHTSGGDSHYHIKYSDGSRFRFTPWSNDNPYAMQGTIEVILPTKLTAQSVDTAIAKLADMGFDTKVADRAAMENLYLRKHAYATGEINKTSWKSLEAKIEGKSTEEQNKLMQKWWAKKLNVEDITTIPSYRPEGVYELGNADKSLRGGYWSQMRFDITAKDLDEKMPNFVLTHSLSERSTLEFIKSVFETNESLISTTEKLRVGIMPGGMSPASDMRTGGAGYAFTRIKSSNQDHITLKKEALLRLDSISYSKDNYGRVTGAAPQNRAKNIEDWRKWSRYSGNETIFKYRLNLLEWGETFNVRNSAEKVELIAYLKSKGIEVLPDGRSLEQVVQALST